MAFLDDLSKKTKNLSEIAKCNSAIAEDERNCNNTLLLIGRKYAELHANDGDHAPEEFRPLLYALHQAQMRIAENKRRIEDLKGLPPAIIITAENDVLRDEGEEYARRLDEAGVEVINFRVNGTIHDFMMLNALQNTCQTKSVLRLTSALLKEIFNKQKPD